MKLCCKSGVNTYSANAAGIPLQNSLGFLKDNAGKRKHNISKRSSLQCSSSKNENGCRGEAFGNISQKGLVLKIGYLMPKWLCLSM